MCPGRCLGTRKNLSNFSLKGFRMNIWCETVIFTLGNQCQTLWAPRVLKGSCKIRSVRSFVPQFSGRFLVIVSLVFF